MKIINLSRVGIPKKKHLRFFSSKVCIQGCPQDCPKGCPQCFPQIFKQGCIYDSPPKQYIRQYPLNFLLNSQAQFLLLILLLVCHFIFLVLFVLSDRYIFHIHVIFIPKLPFEIPSGCLQGFNQIFQQGCIYDSPKSST